MNKLYEELKIDLCFDALLNNTNGTGEFFSMKGCHRALFCYAVTNLAATKSGKVEILEATDEDGTGAQAISGADALITASTGVYMENVALASTGAGDTITINGVTFTQGSTDVAAKTFADAAGLKACIDLEANLLSTTVGADVSTTNVILRSIDGKQKLVVTRENVGGTITLSTLKALGYVEIENMSLSSGFSHVAAKVTTTDATGNCSNTVILLRQLNKVISQQVGDYAAV